MTQPEWITQALSPSDIAAINQGGCASGAYMPAVTYHQAQDTMLAHGDQVLQYIEDNYGDLPEPERGISWSGLAVLWLSFAVELFCQEHDGLADWDDEDDIDWSDTEGN